MQDPNETTEELNYRSYSLKYGHSFSAHATGELVIKARMHSNYKLLGQIFIFLKSKSQPKTQPLNYQHTK